MSSWGLLVLIVLAVGLIVGRRSIGWELPSIWLVVVLTIAILVVNDLVIG